VIDVNETYDTYSGQYLSWNYI